MGVLENTPMLEVPEPRRSQVGHVLICAGQAQARAPTDGASLIEIGSVLEFGRGSVDGALPRLQTDDPRMSRTHAIIRSLDGKTALVRDLDSRNGTFIDGELLNDEQPLRDGAVIFMGAHVFVYRLMSRADLAAIAADLSHPLGPVPTHSAVMARLAGRLRKLARWNVDLLLGSETGVGKEVLAEAIHRESGRSGPFVAINCAALPDTFIESELFGYARGAHSMAQHGKPGLIEGAENGTLFLDEIGDMPHNAQSKLLRFLQDRQLLSLGTTRLRKLNVRVVAATHREITCRDDLQGLRLDLAARLGPEPLVIPPLRDRPEDIGLLVSHFLRDRPRAFDIRAYRALFLRKWPGNVRELEKAVQLAGILSESHDSIEIGDLPSDPGQTIDQEATDDRRLPSERPTPLELVALLERHRGNVGRVARELGRQRTLVWRWLRKDGLKPAAYRDGGLDRQN